MKLLPVINDVSAKFFCNGEDGQPRTFKVNDDGVVRTTGFLRTGQKLSLLGISQPPELIASGMMDTTDSVDSLVRIRSLAIGTPKGHVVKGVVHMDDYIPGGAPEGVRHVVMNLASGAYSYEGQKMNLQMAGRLDLQTGELEIHAADPGLGGLQIIGYYLEADTINYNRRPRQ